MNSLAYWILALQDTATEAVEVAGASHSGFMAFVERIIYVASAIMFVFGIKMMSSPRTARKGNIVASAGMLVAVIITLFDKGVIGIGVLTAGIIVGSVIGAFSAMRVAMTSMPEMVALFNGSGGAASAVVALGEFWRPHGDDPLMADTAVAIGLSLLIGMWTLTGSLVAFAKLRGMTIAGIRLSNPVTFPAQHVINFVMMAAALALTLTLAFSPTATWAVVLLLLISLAIGVFFTIPIGGADMPVVVSLLNSYSGIAACATGFVLNNFGLIISGALVGASGLILTMIMCKAMDRSLVNVLAGGFGQDSGGAAGPTGASGPVTFRKVDAEEAAMMLEAARNVVIVP
ncbi:MAG: NAD(P)(+) transhydrogenase (Re/Si-specific) subunit beta, partial [Phycisphaerales bacterium]|nr:NAD(P)(+) transhydrogenase (Re/Si-specific) subunit beta [Phycisphaerales bacterium]